jgi:hypothetical protein
MNLCKNGHDRDVVGVSKQGQCRECRRGYGRKHREANKEKCLAYQREWHKNNPEKVKENRRRTKSKNAESIRRQNAVYRAANPEKIKAANKRWLDANQHKPREYGRKRAGIINLPAVCAEIGDPCECCRQPMKKTPHAEHDHVTGLFRGWVCQKCNIRLGILDNKVWMAQAQDYLHRVLTPTSENNKADDAIDGEQES